LLNFGKVLLLENKHRFTPKKTRGAGIVVAQKLHEETWNATSNLCWQSVQDPCSIAFENCRCSWNRSSWRWDM